MTALGLNLFGRRKPDEAQQAEQQARKPNLPKDVPENVHEAYSQALFLVDVSPRASGALSRFCLQHIIRDFWNLPADNKRTLKDEFKDIADRLAPETLSSIECVRRFGTIDSHFSKDRDMMVETTQGEATMLLALVQLLIHDWYLERSKRNVRFETIKKMAENTARKDEARPEPKADERPEELVHSGTPVDEAPADASLTDRAETSAPVAEEPADGKDTAPASSRRAKRK